MNKEHRRIHHSQVGVALRNFNETTHKYKRWVDRWYYNLGTLECRVCERGIVDVRDVCLYYGKVMHVDCITLARVKMIRRTDTKHGWE